MPAPCAKVLFLPCSRCVKGWVDRGEVGLRAVDAERLARLVERDAEDLVGRVVDEVRMLMAGEA